MEFITGACSAASSDVEAIASKCTTQWWWTLLKQPSHCAALLAHPRRTDLVRHGDPIDHRQEKQWSFEDSWGAAHVRVGSERARRMSMRQWYCSDCGTAYRAWGAKVVGMGSR